MKEPTRVLLADEHPIFRNGLVRALERDRGFLVVGQAADGGEALKLIMELHPDLAVLDVSMPVIDGLEVARRVHQAALPVDLVVMTMYIDAKYFNTALDLGVRGYVVKDSAALELLLCLRAVAAGQYYVSPNFAHLLVERHARADPGETEVALRKRMTPAEFVILKLVSENMTSREIADRLFVSVRTVENHRAHICFKLGLKGPHALLQYALENKAIL